MYHLFGEVFLPFTFKIPVSDLVFLLQYLFDGNQFLMYAC